MDLKQVESVIEFEPGLDSFTQQLMDMKTAQARVCLLYASWVLLFFIWNNKPIKLR